MKHREEKALEQLFNVQVLFLCRLLILINDEITLYLIYKNYDMVQYVN